MFRKTTVAGTCCQMGRLERKTLTPTLSQRAREHAAPGVQRVAAHRAWLPGVAATLTPALSLNGDLCVTGGAVARKTLTPTLSHGEREQEPPHLRGRGTFCKGLPGERDLCVTRGRLPGRPLTPTLSPRRGSKSGRTFADEERCAKVSEEREQERPHLRGRRALCKGLSMERVEERPAQRSVLD